jgi:hypothetical protein
MTSSLDSEQRNIPTNPNSSQRWVDQYFLNSEYVAFLEQTVGEKVLGQFVEKWNLYNQVSGSQAFMCVTLK